MMKHLLNEWKKYLAETLEQIPDDIMERYLEGNCLTFAKALSEVLDASIYAVIAGTGGNDATCSHVVVEYDGKYWDISGGHSEQELIDKYEENLGAAFVEVVPYDPSYWQHYDLDKDGYYDEYEEDEDVEENDPPEELGQHFPESKEETLKWANIIAKQAKGE
jgi:hypothetical protein